MTRTPPGTTLGDAPEVGQVDEMSRLRRQFALPSCGEEHPVGKKSSVHCTRAAGHAESKPGHAGTAHVATLHKYVAVAVW